ncbi:MAG: universal stress protein [Cytophagales bacterium]|nr:universal stress protein [Cytophagales bacterium]
MKTILVPTDFSEIARTATDYAVMLARKSGARIILLHAIPRHSPRLKDVDAELVEKARHRQEKIKEELVAAGLPADCVDTQVINLFPLGDVVEDLVQTLQIDLIVMGTRGASGLRKTILGSFTTDVIEHSSAPVIAVPAHAPAKISRIAYATDLCDVTAEIKTLVPYAQMFGADIHILHVQPPVLEKCIDETALLSQFNGQQDCPPLHLTVEINDDIDEAINDFIVRNNADMLAMFTRNRSFFEWVFYRSYTEQMCYHTQVPLLAFKKPKA